ncbi:Phospholipase A I [Colletotrichum fructicola Nara gc5]|uniref:Phospholipase A I n=1 Tax=Colletotrichum fructicola (strain Nara gc5) TaxID=1213859 RepID=A0A7J6IDV2_COLFN|nr:Phospholipase A I [Colletotrichum fructicola Nara gc5]
MISTHDAICFFVQDPLSARNTLSRWITECNRLDLEFRPAAVIILDSAVENDEADRLRSLLEEDPPSAFFHSVSVHSVRGYGGRLPSSVFGRMREVRAMRNANHLLWDWHTMFKLSHGLLRQLAGRSPSPQRDINVGYVSALDLERTPQPLQEATEWLADTWCSWIEQTTSEEEALQMRLPILAHAIAVDAAISYKGFHVRAVFDQLHRHIVKKALSRRKIVSAAYGMAVVASHVDKTAENALDHMLQHYQKSRVKFLKEHQPSLADSRSSDLCLLCFVRPADIFLPCECALCETCCRSYGRPTTGTVTAFDRCVWCGMLFAGGCAIRQKPITAGCRVLALDGGGVKGIVQLHVLEAIEKLTKLPIRIFFDLAIGTSVGGINALSIGVLQWPLDRLQHQRVEAFDHIHCAGMHRDGRETGEQYIGARGAETTSAAPCLFPAKRIGDRLLYDGIDIPLPHVRASALRRQLKIDAELWATMKQTSWAMISALFYFQLQKPPNVAGRHGQLHCEGIVACRYEDDAAIMKILATEYPGLVALVDG